MVIPAPLLQGDEVASREPAAPSFFLDGAWRFIPSFAVHNFAVDTMNKKILLIAQILMTFMMALLMSGIMSLIALGPTKQWLSVWPIQFIIAWPIAFILTQFTSKIAFTLAPKLAAKV